MIPRRSPKRGRRARAAPRRPPGEPADRPLAGHRIALAIAGSVAAYKAAALARLLVRAGASVEAVLTASARRFLGASTLGGITGRPVLGDMFDPATGGELHVDLAARSDLVLVVPATADLLARLAVGRADDLVTATVLSARCPVLAAPAMHPAMWAHPATARNVATLAADGRVELVGPVDGEVASGDTGVGRMAEPERILAAAIARLFRGDLAGRHVVVTAGPTVEDIDPVRFIGNRSSGKMGFSIAERARARGARVTLVTGPVSLSSPRAVARADVRSALEMREAVRRALGPRLDRADALVMAAAVGDYRPASARGTKMKRGAEPLTLELVPNPDILAETGAARSRLGRAGGRPVLVGFAVETGTDEDLARYARDKLASKRVDAVVANQAAEAFGREESRVVIVEGRGARTLGPAPKPVLADRILDYVAGKLAEGGSRRGPGVASGSRGRDRGR